MLKINKRMPQGTYPPPKIEDHIKLVYSIVNKYRFDGIEYEELVNEGLRGLNEAILRFDGSTRISSYAYFWIRKYVLSYLKRTCEKNRHEFSYFSHDATEEIYYNCVDDGAEQKIWNNVGKTDFKIICKKSRLTQLEKFVLCQHWGIGVRKKTFMEIGKIVGTSYEWCRVIEKKAMEKIKSYLIKENERNYEQ